MQINKANKHIQRLTITTKNKIISHSPNLQLTSTLKIGTEETMHARSRCFIEVLVRTTKVHEPASMRSFFPPDNRFELIITRTPCL